MTELRIETVNINSLTLDPANARKHDGKNLKAIENSLLTFGQRKPIVVTPDSIVVAGNGTLEAAKSLGWTEIAVARTPIGWGWDQIKAFALADNRTAELAEWDDTILAEQLLELDANGWQLEDIGFTNLEPPFDPALLEEDHIPSPPIDPISKLGNIWQLGEHRVMCGDSTNMEHVARLTNNRKAVLLHADPPYGMGKENDGVQNDNLYTDKLDAFQMLWWQTWRKHLEDNASAYIWGNAEDLWRLWFGGLVGSERLTFRNEIAWLKNHANGQMSSGIRMFPKMTERALFFMLGEQGFNNNADNYWDGFEPIRIYLYDQRELMQWNNKIVANFFGFNPRMADHWFSKSQWSFPQKEQYERLQIESGNEAFKRDYDSLKRDYDSLKRDYDSLKREFYATRAFFDNTHEILSDVWIEPVVYNEERHGHATPKPLKLMQRVMKSSAPEQGLVFEPFGGSGSTLIGAEQTGRICYTMELTPSYVDVIVKRWENLTGKTAELLED